MTDDCIFCKIVAGEIPSTEVRSDDEFIAIRDVAPKADTHVLVIPRVHHADINEWVAAGASSDKLHAFAVATARELGVADGYRLIANTGSPAGQTVFHLHLHILAGDHLVGF
ncbi:MAG: histidine triad nucleotide-binding protein [Thermoleophilia bacterium]|nr:histidine triad nucleotide-binding protein [Thermoleophilia bacterium]